MKIGMRCEQHVQTNYHDNSLLLRLKLKAKANF